MAASRRTVAFGISEHHAEPCSVIAEQLGTRIRAIRLDRGWSLRHLSAVMEVSPATLSAIENGRTNITVERLVALADVLGTSAVRLVGKGRLEEVDRTILDKKDDLVTNSDWRSFRPLAIDAVLSAAIDAFVDTGYHGSTMRDIAQRAGMSVPGVYHHYTSKQSLLVRILDLTMDDLEWRMLAARNSERTPVRRLAILIEALALFHVLRADLAFIGASEMRSLDDTERLRVAKRRTAVQHLIDTEIYAVLDAGSDISMTAKGTGRAIATMCTSLPQWFNTSGSTSPAEIAQDYSRIALRMVGVRDHELLAD